LKLDQVLGTRRHGLQHTEQENDHQYSADSSEHHRSFHASIAGSLSQSFSPCADDPTIRRRRSTAPPQGSRRVTTKRELDATARIRFGAGSTTWAKAVPRLGLTYDVTADRKTVAKISDGLYGFDPGINFTSSVNPNQSQESVSYGVDG
jgi:hypothetical protein